MRRSEVFRAWGRILTGRYPAMSIEITRECPLKCPGCYAYEPDHIQGAGPLRTLVDRKGEQLVEDVLALVRKHKPIHLSIVGGEPLVRFRELNVLLPKLSEMGLAVQLVTSAVREIPAEWANIPELYLVVSIDGLQPEHDERRKPATYARILKNISGHRIVVHCTITGQTVDRPGYNEEFARFWSARPEVKKIWFSLFTPQVGAEGPELLTPASRRAVISELARLREDYPKIEFPDTVVRGMLNPPRSPAECIFAGTTVNFTADLTNRVVPCQFGGTPDCSQCGCIASAGLAAIGQHKIFNILPLRTLYDASDRVGNAVARLSN